MDAANAVGDRDHRALVAGVRDQIEALDFALEQFTNFRGVQLHSNCS